MCYYVSVTVFVVRVSLGVEVSRLSPAPYTIATGRLTQRRAYYRASEEHLYSLVLTDRRTQPVRKRREARGTRDT